MKQLKRMRACLKFHQSAASDKFCSALRYIFRRIARIRLQNMSCSEQNLPAFAQSWKFKHALNFSVLQTLSSDFIIRYLGFASV